MSEVDEPNEHQVEFFEAGEDAPKAFEAAEQPVGGELEQPTRLLI
jgi:hypothetical protein